MTKNWHLVLARAIREAAPGETIYVDTEIQVELGNRAAKRMGKDVEFKVRSADNPLLPKIEQQNAGKEA